MTVQFFVDTKILIYAASNRPEDRQKRTRANELIGGEAFGLSGQVMAEFYAVVTSKGNQPMPAVQAIEWLEMLELQECASIDAGLVKRGAEISERYKISYWDGAIIAAAEELGASKLYTEDLNDGQSYGPVMVVNPFRGI